MDRHTFCERLKKARKKANITQDEVAKVLAIPTSAVSAMENGQRKVEVLELDKLARLYSTNISYFFDQIEKDNTNPINERLSNICNLLSKAPLAFQRAIECAIIGFFDNNKNSGTDYEKE